MADRTPAKRGNGPGRGGSARGYSWPPFEPGNKAAVKHGALSPELVEPRARELRPLVFDVNPHLALERDGAAVYRYCVTLARIERVYAWLGEQLDPVFDDAGQGNTHGVYERLERWERQADGAEERLAIAPLTRAKLGLDQLRAVATAEETEASRAARERLDRRAADLDGNAEEVEG